MSPLVSGLYTMAIKNFIQFKCAEMALIFYQMSQSLVNFMLYMAIYTKRVGYRNGVNLPNIWVNSEMMFVQQFSVLDT